MKIDWIEAMTEQGIHERYGTDADTTSSLPAHAGLRPSENRYRRLFETARHGILLLNFDTAHIEDSNPHLAQMLGYPHTELLGTRLWEAPPFRNTALDHASFIELQRAGYLRLDNLALETRQGTSITVEFTAHVYECEGSPVIQCHIRDIEEAGNRLQELARQLETARRDLESFSHSITHDLRSPLGQIDGFAFLLGMEYANAKLDAKAQGYIQRIRAATKQMVALIDDLWSLSRISRAELHSQQVDLSDMAQALAIDQRNPPQPRNVEFVIASGLTATADADLMRIVLDNLLKNARRFTAGQEHARIEFGMLENEGEPVYFIKDNGAGFDLADKVQLFTQLQRMNSMQEFDGAGIRFAKAERAIQRQGGKIWAESAAGRGAIFYFTL
ncbi:MAG TPA: ATP-binding protein [Novimethylophilus sp.]|uniref:sensor histidine kinase n=1 Tax=Novimethylophilus sp. TaxID=2137426 RepID=UPI002F420CC5